MKLFFKAILRAYRRFLENQIDPDRYDQQLSRELDCLNFLIEDQK